MTLHDSQNSTADLPLLDEAQLRELEDIDARQGGGLLRRLIELFESQGPDAFNALRQAIVEGDSAAVAATAHSLKGGYRSLGVSRAAGLAAELEQLGRDDALEAAPAVLDRLEGCFAASRVALNERFGGAD